MRARQHQIVVCHWQGEHQREDLLLGHFCLNSRMTIVIHSATMRSRPAIESGVNLSIISPLRVSFSLWCLSRRVEAGGFGFRLAGLRVSVGSSLCFAVPASRLAISL